MVLKDRDKMRSQLSQRRVKGVTSNATQSAYALYMYLHQNLIAMGTVGIAGCRGSDLSAIPQIIEPQ
jgi:hypothetical protein